MDDLTDDQIKVIVQKAELSGMTESEIEIAARAKGMSDSEILKFKKRLAELKISTNNNKTSVERNRDTNIEKDSTDKKENPLAKKIFGFSLFTNTNLSFEPSTNIATPLNYQLGPGDKLIIDIWGASQEPMNKK